MPQIVTRAGRSSPAMAGQFAFDFGAMMKSNDVPRAVILPAEEIIAAAEAPVAQEEVADLIAPAASELLEDAGAFSPDAAENSDPASDVAMSPSLDMIEDEPVAAAGPDLSSNFVLHGTRDLAADWRQRAEDNLTAIRLTKTLATEKRPATAAEQALLARYVGWGASELANRAFRDHYSKRFANSNCTQIGEAIEAELTPEALAAATSGTQWAHYTPEWLIDALWAGLVRLGFRHGAVLEPGAGIGLFGARVPEMIRGSTRMTMVEIDPTAAGIATNLFPAFDVRCADFTALALPPHYDAAIGNPPFADVAVFSDPAFKALKPRLHDFFILKALDRLRPGGVAAFVTSRYTLDKKNAKVRTAMAERADLVAAFRLPACAFKETAGTETVTDVLFFRRRLAGEEHQYSTEWLNTGEFSSGVAINQYYLTHRHHILGTATTTYDGRYARHVLTVRRPANSQPTDERLMAALDLLPEAIHEPRHLAPADDDAARPAIQLAAEKIELPAHAREGSFVLGAMKELCYITEGHPTRVPLRAKGQPGLAKIDHDRLRALIPVRDATRAVLAEQLAGRTGAEAQRKLNLAYDAFVRQFGAINLTTVSERTDAQGNVQETRRQPNLAAFREDPDCYLTASIENYDEETGKASKGPIFSRIVAGAPAAPKVSGPADALRVSLDRRGQVDQSLIASLLGTSQTKAMSLLGRLVYENPETGIWQTAENYLSGNVRKKLGVAKAAALADQRFARNVAALEGVQPADLLPSEISAKLGAPWIPTDILERFVAEVLGDDHTRISHLPQVAAWSVNTGWELKNGHNGTSTWGTERRSAADLLGDALAGSIPVIHDTIEDGNGGEKRVLNAKATEAAQDKLRKIQAAFEDWVWTEPSRADRLARIYNEKFNALRAPTFDGSHLSLPGLSPSVSLRRNQKDAIWRILTSGNTYLAHVVGAGKTLSQICAAMELRRLGMASKPCLVVPNHVLQQFAREWLRAYPHARILVADEENFEKSARRRFLARATIEEWDGIVISHSAFGLIPPCPDAEESLIDEQLWELEQLLTEVDEKDRKTRKQIEHSKSSLKQKLARLEGRRKDDAIFFDMLGIDFIMVDEAHEFRKLSFLTRRGSVKGIDPEGSQRSWDLYVKSRILDRKSGYNGRSLVLASGTPVANTMGELWSACRYLIGEELSNQGIHMFDAWANAFGETVTALEMQPDGKWKPVTRFARFVNLPELISLFRQVADVVDAADLRTLVAVPSLVGGERKIVEARTGPAFKAFQKTLADRLEAIRNRSRAPTKGDDIHLSVLTDGRHAAVALPLALPGAVPEAGCKLEQLVANLCRIWRDTADDTFLQPDGTPFPRRGGAQMVFCDLGVPGSEERRGFSVYNWVRDELIARGIPDSQIAFMQNYKKTAEKQRLFNMVNAGEVRILIGSTKTMGTGVNAQLRLRALHHVDVPWYPAELEQREGRIIRPGNNYTEVDIFCYVSVGSLDSTSWQTLKRKKTFIDQAMRGDLSVRAVEDLDPDVNAYALAQALASGDDRILHKAGLEADLARLRRLKAAHLDEQFEMRRRLSAAERDLASLERQIPALKTDIERRIDTRGKDFAISFGERVITARPEAAKILMSKVRLLELERAAGRHVVAHIGGFDLVYEGWNSPGLYQRFVALALSADDREIRYDEDTAPDGFLRRVENAIEDLDDMLRRSERAKDIAIRDIAQIGETLAKPFDRSLELQEKEAELHALEEALAKEAEEAERGEDPQGASNDAATDDGQVPEKLAA